MDRRFGFASEGGRSGLGGPNKIEFVVRAVLAEPLEPLEKVRAWNVATVEAADWALDEVFRLSEEG